jgi:hypothetical protein
VKDNEELEVGQRKCLFRKTSGMLQDHYQKHKRHANAVATMNQVSLSPGRSIMDRYDEVRSRLRTAAGNHHFSALVPRLA